MYRISCIFFLFLPLFSKAQTGDMRVYTVAGSLTATALGDGGPASAASLSATEGIWMDNNCNLYISDMGHARIRKANIVTGTITSIAGTGVAGFSGDDGIATNAKIKVPYGLYVDNIGNIFFADNGNNRIRKIDAITGIISTFAGGGTNVGEGIPATSAQLYSPQSVYGDSLDNIFISESGKIRKVDIATGNIITIAGTGISGYSGDNGPATASQLSLNVAGMIFDKNGNLFIADRSNSRIRKISSSTGIINTVAGSSTYGYSGDGGQATNAQLRGPISIAIDYLGNLLIGDNVNDAIRRVDMVTGVITTIAGTGSMSGSIAEGALATATEMHPEFIYLDLYGNIFYSNFGKQIRKITGYKSGLIESGSRCGMNVSVEKIESKAIIAYPNPACEYLFITEIMDYQKITILNFLGQVVLEKQIEINASFPIDIKELPDGMYCVQLQNNNNFKIINFIKKSSN